MSNVFFDQCIVSENQKVELPILTQYGVELWIKREDQIHEFVSGNKFRKLKYNVHQAKKENFSALLTFGGAYSNHIVATAVAGKISGLKTIGVIRGEELADNLETVLTENFTLKTAHENGMHFEFVSRADFKRKTNPDFIDDLKCKLGDFYTVPEGGTNVLAIKGCQEILTLDDRKFDYICCAVGTGGTISGLINSSTEAQKIVGYPALKGDFLVNDITNLISNQQNWILKDYHFGGYAKVNQSLISFMNWFYAETRILLDPVYTGKMLFGIFEDIKKGFYPKGSKIIVIHTGGLQGISGMNRKLRKQCLQEIVI